MAAQLIMAQIKGFDFAKAKPLLSPWCWSIPSAGITYRAFRAEPRCPTYHFLRRPRRPNARYYRSFFGLGQARLPSPAAAGARLIAWCRDCHREVEPDPGQMARPLRRRECDGRLGADARTLSARARACPACSEKSYRLWDQGLPRAPAATSVARPELAGARLQLSRAVPSIPAALRSSPCSFLRSDRDRVPLVRCGGNSTKHTG
jgi:hypothetical protein